MADLEVVCCFCKEAIEPGRPESVGLDPTALVVISNVDQEPEGQHQQQFWCHFGCFRRLINDDSLLHIMHMAESSADTDDERIQ
jgi:hypothetical protein